MSNRAQAVATALQSKLPQLTVRPAQTDDAPGKVNVFNGPVAAITENGDYGFTINLFTDEGDDIDSLAARVFRASVKDAYDVDGAEGGHTMRLSFKRMEPILDEADFRIGESLIFNIIENQPQAPKAA